MNKKGAEFAVGTIVMLVLGLVVLVILILVVRQQITKGAEKYTDIREEATIKKECTSPRTCSNECRPDQHEVFSLTGVWANCGPNQSCCEANR